MAKYVLFSPIAGKILIDGKPVVGATVTRWYKGGFSDKQATDTSKTDDAGAFSFPVATFNSIIASIIPHEAVISQEIKVLINGTETLIYFVVKRNYELNGEYGGQSLNFVFDPTVNPSFITKDSRYPSISVTLAVQ